MEEKCSICGNSKTADHFYEGVKNHIDKYGWSIVGVLGEDDIPGWAYTIGLTELNHPEIVMSGLPHETMHTILNDIGISIKKKDLRLEDEMLLEGFISNGYTLKIRKIDTEKYEERVQQAFRYYDRAIEAFQIMWPDKEGRFPDEENFTGKHVQEVYD